MICTHAHKERVNFDSNFAIALTVKLAMGEVPV